MSTTIRAIQIYDTTLRDGSQGEGVNFSVIDKLQIAERLDEAGVDWIEGGYPLSNPKDAEFFEQARRLSLTTAKLCAFGMTRRKGSRPETDPGMEALLRTEAPVVTIVGKTWDFHVTEVLQVSLEENLAMIGETIAFLRKHRRVFYDAEHFFDGWQENPEYSARTIQAAAQAGAELIVLCDTNGGSLPNTIADLTRAAAAALGPPHVPLGIHCHNDCDLAVANSLAAVEAGAVQVQGTINGIGERCGNADLISVIANLGLKRPNFEILGGRDLVRLTELSRFVYETANMPFRSAQPFVGSSAFAHKGGMHVHAVSKATRAYEHLDPRRVGNERRVLISELSGRSNVAALLGDQGLNADRELMDVILQQVVELEHQGFQFEAALASFDLLVRRCQGTFRPHFELLKYHVTVEQPEMPPEARIPPPSPCSSLVGEDTGKGRSSVTELRPETERRLPSRGNEMATRPLTEASIKVKIGDQIRHEVAEGDGPVNALDAALRKALRDHFPVLQSMRLVDYRVRVVNEEAGTAARIRVVIESTDGKQTWGTVGVSENIIEASWRALADAIEYKLWQVLPASP